MTMLGGFSVTMDGNTLQSGDNRSRKLWLLLAYLSYYRNRSISQTQLLELLWEGEEGSANPANALKTMLHRLRALLDTLSPGAGHLLIISQGGTYALNPDIPVELDTDLFEAGCKAAKIAATEEQRLDAYLKVLPLYGGDFLPKFSDQSWVMPISAYLHGLYTQAISEVLPLLEARGRLETASDLCRRAIALDPYDESLYYHLMRQLLDMGQQDAAAQVYQTMSDMLIEQFGIMPSDELKALYREAQRASGDHEVDITSLREQLAEPNAAPGALLCDYDFFKVLCSAEARSISRSGMAVHIGLFSLASSSGCKLPKRSLDRCMDNLGELICQSLRRGDIAARCSVSQFILLLPQANFENSQKVLGRILKQFNRQYPHSPAVLSFSVQPLDPTA
ncbi:MAG: BTAD domain-containing putative transcriptional regulator [Oscillospiraceae bacterium]